MTFLFDTNIISELAKPRPNTGVLTWSSNISLVLLSVISIEEISYGLTAKPNPRIQAWFKEFLTTFCHIIPITPEIAEKAGELRGLFRSQGKTRTQADMLIAATAYVHQLTLVTRNTKDFVDCQITIFNPFSDFNDKPI